MGKVLTWHWFNEPASLCRQLEAGMRILKKMNMQPKTLKELMAAMKSQKKQAVIH